MQNLETIIEMLRDGIITITITIALISFFYTILHFLVAA